MRVLFLTIGAIAAAGVFATMYRAVWAYRRTNEPPYFHGKVGVELVWTAVPCLIWIAGAVPAARLILAVNP
jgi:heme/copper-type cytochrome/quinol oxidase subunit 2